MFSSLRLWRFWSSFFWLQLNFCLVSSTFLRICSLGFSHYLSPIRWCVLFIGHSTHTIFIIIRLVEMLLSLKFKLLFWTFLLNRSRELVTKLFFKIYISDSTVINCFTSVVVTSSLTGRFTYWFFSKRLNRSSLHNMSCIYLMRTPMTFYFRIIMKVRKRKSWWLFSLLVFIKTSVVSLRLNWITTN